MKHFYAKGLTMAQILGFSKIKKEESEEDLAEERYKKRLARLHQLMHQDGRQVLSNNRLPRHSVPRNDSEIGGRVPVKSVAVGGTRVFAVSRTSNLTATDRLENQCEENQIGPQTERSELLRRRMFWVLQPKSNQKIFRPLIFQRAWGSATGRLQIRQGFWSFCPTKGLGLSGYEDAKPCAQERKLVLNICGRMLFAPTLIVLLIFVSGLFTAVQAQSRQDTGAADGRALQIGDAIPEELWNLPLQVVNHPDGKKTITLSDYRDRKLIILDFWATWCGSCVTSFDRLDRLAREFGKTVVIVPVSSRITKDREATVKAFFDSREKRPSLISVVEDTVLARHFPGRSLPHYVWISEDRFISATRSDDLSAKTIGHYLSTGNAPSTGYVRYDRNRPLQEQLSIPPATRQYGRGIYGYIAGVGTASGTLKSGDKNGGTEKIYAINMPLALMVRMAYPEYSGFAENRIIYESADPEKFRLDRTDPEWRRQHLYSYEKNFLGSDRNRAYELMKEDLRHALGISVDIREVDTLVYRIVTGSGTVKTSMVTEKAMNIHDPGVSRHYMRGYPLSVLVHHLNQVSPVHFRDDSGLRGNVDLDFQGDYADPEILRTALRKIGLDLKVEKEKLTYLIISDKHTITPKNHEENL